MRQLRAVAIAAGLAVVGSAVGVAEAPALLVSAAAVLGVLVLLAAAARVRVRDCTLDLIADGGDDVPLACVERERRRLLSRTRRSDLARHVDLLRRLGGSPAARRALPHLVIDRGVLAAVAPDLRQIAQLLVADGARPAGIARTERALAKASSALYGDDVHRARWEVRRIGALLSGEGL